MKEVRSAEACPWKGVLGSGPGLSVSLSIFPPTSFPASVKGEVFISHTLDQDGLCQPKFKGNQDEQNRLTIFSCDPRWTLPPYTLTSQVSSHNLIFQAFCHRDGELTSPWVKLFFCLRAVIHPYVGKHLYHFLILLALGPWRRQQSVWYTGPGIPSSTHTVLTDPEWQQSHGESTEEGSTFSSVFFILFWKPRAWWGDWLYPC